MHAQPIRFTNSLRILLLITAHVLRPIHILHKPARNQFSLPVVSNTLRDELFRETGGRRRSEGTPFVLPHVRRVSADEPDSPSHAAGCYTHSHRMTSAMSRSHKLLPARGDPPHPALQCSWTNQTGRSETRTI